MSRVSRRSFMAGMATVSAGLCFSKYSFSSPIARVRYEARTPEGKKMLSIYKVAVDNMMNKIKKGDPRSWPFQWYTHAVPPNFDPQNKVDQIKSIYPNGGPYKDLANIMWNTCQAHAFPGDRPDCFLPWHRMYVYYFEQIIRYAANDDSFTLPYWNYSAGQQSAKIPEEFRVAGPLLKPNRKRPPYPDVNAGDPIATDSQLSTKDALSEPTYGFQSAAHPGFNATLNGRPHGAVHVAVGDGTNMGIVPTAAGDPVFWLHHSNIDRLWASWNANGGKNPDKIGDTSWADKQFTFAAADGNPAKKTNREVSDMANLGYRYDRLEPAPPNFRPAARAALLNAPFAKFAEAPAASLVLGRGPARLTLEHSPTNKNRLLSDELNALGTERSLRCLIRRLPRSSGRRFHQRSKRQLRGHHQFFQRGTCSCRRFQP
jgi:tyrosinase